MTRSMKRDASEVIAARASEIEDAIAAGKITAAQVFTQMRQLLTLPATEPADAGRDAVAEAGNDGSVVWLTVAPPKAGTKLYTRPPSEAAAADDAMAQVGELIRTQNNRLTEQPIFIVQQRHGRGQRWDFVTACFTEQGCKDYIAKDGHNLKEPRIYAAGSYRNEEWRAVRKHLMALASQQAVKP